MPTVLLDEKTKKWIDTIKLLTGSDHNEIVFKALERMWGANKRLKLLLSALEEK